MKYPPRRRKRHARREHLSFNPAELACAIGHASLTDEQRRVAAALLIQVPEVAAVTRSIDEVIEVCERTPAAEWEAMAAFGGRFTARITL